MVKLSNIYLAEDLVQETFITSFEKFDTFDNDKNPEPWLKTILHNKIVDYYRKNSKLIIENIENNNVIAKNTNEVFKENGHWNVDKIAGLINLKEHESDEDILDFLNYCLQNLPDFWKTVISAKYFSDQNSNEICVDLDISKSNYWQIIHRSKTALRKCISLKINSKN